MIEHNRNDYLGEILSDTVKISGRIFCAYPSGKLVVSDRIALV